MTISARGWQVPPVVLLPHLGSACVAAALPALTLALNETLISAFFVGSFPTLPLRLWAMMKTPTVVPVSHDTKVPVLAGGQVDVTIAPLAVTPQREKVVDFIVYSNSALCRFGLGANPKLANLQGIHALDTPTITIAYFTGTPPEHWLPQRLPKAMTRAVQGSGANAPVDEILSHRADVAPIDNVAWPELSKQVPGLVTFPSGDACLQSNEMATPIGMAIDKAQPALLAWMRAEEREDEPMLQRTQMRLMKAGGWLRAAMDFAPILSHWRFLANALAVTLLITGLSIAAGCAIGVLVAFGRSYGGRWLAGVLGLYVDTMRANPAAGDPGLGLLRRATGAGLGVVAGHGRGRRSVDPPRRLHGRDRARRIAVGAPRPDARGAGARHEPGHRRRTIILPQAAIRMLPSVGSLLVVAVKDSGIASVIAVPELIRQSQVLSGLTYRSFEIYTVAMGVYFALCYPIARGVDALYRRGFPWRVVTLDWGVLWTYREPLLRGLGVTVALAVTTMALAVPFGLLLAFGRMSRRRAVRMPTTAFVEVFRSTPLLLQEYWAFYVLPALVGIGFSAVTTALIGLVCNVASFNSETFRAGILSIRPGQTSAGLAIGMGRAQVMRHIVLPQAVRRVLPALATTWVSLFKDTSLVSTIAVADLSYAALQIRSETFRTMEVLTGTGKL